MTFLRFFINSITKTGLLRVLVALFLCPCIYGADINDVNGLAAAAKSGGSYTIAGGTYHLEQALSEDEQLVFNSDTTLVPVGGNVIINGDYIHMVSFRDANYVIGDSTGKYRINFCNGSWNCVEIDALYANVNAEFYYCDFSYADAINGITAQVGMGHSVQSVLNYCRAYSNCNDGFSLKNELGNTYKHDKNVMILNHCKAYDNGDNGTTAHDNGQVMIVNGGEYFRNLSCHVFTGMSYESGSTLYLKGGVLTYDNYYEDIRMGWNSNLFVEDANITARGYGLASIEITSARVCGFDGLNLNVNKAHTGGIYVSGTNTLFYIRNSVIRNCTRDGCAGLLVEGGAAGRVSNCTFYNNYYHCYTDGGSVGLGENIFASALRYAVFTRPGIFYKDNTENGLNLFYANKKDFSNSQDEHQSSDILENQEFVDANNNDFRLMDGSPCLNAGGFSSAGGKRNIGAWQGAGINLSLPAGCTEQPEMDFNGDCVVDFADLNMFCQSWLQSNLYNP
jgi:hypothetical protein